MNSFKLIHGAGDLLKLVDDVRAKIVKGELEGLTVSFVTTNGHYWYGNAWIDKAPMIWARLVAAQSQAHLDLVRNGLLEK